MQGPEPNPRLTIAEALAKGAAYLLRHGIPADEAPTQAEILTEAAAGLRRSELLLRRAAPLAPEAIDRLRAMLLRVAGGEPVQYVVGRCPFCAAELEVAPGALIPRPETEGLVERVVAHPLWRSARTLADIGTGTGAIAIALALEAKRQRRDLAIQAIDLSPQALALARRNVARNGVENLVVCREGDGLRDFPPRSLDIVVSNPPYISTAEVDALPPLILAHEPRLALDGGPDGLDIIRQLILDATQVLRPGGRLFMEIGDEQGLSARRLLERAGYTAVTIARDLAGHDRYAEGTLP